MASRSVVNSYTLDRRAAEPQPGDERNGDYDKEKLLKMDSKFRARMERAIAHGLERPHGDQERAA